VAVLPYLAPPAFPEGDAAMTSTTTGTTDGVIDAATRRKIVDSLHGRFAGQVIEPDSTDYEQARSVWNAMVDKRPGLILICTSTADVVAAVDVAREFDLAPSVRCGGHNVAGKALSEGGLTIYLGGIGWFSRKHGLTCDNFVELEVVLASGEVVTASDTENPELFWALRGGGGNFGIVTRFTFRTFDFGPLMRIGVSLYHPDEAAQALREYSAIYPTLGRNVGFHAALKHDMPALPFVPPELVGARMLMLISMWLEDAQDPAGTALINRLGAVGQPAVTASTVLPFGAGVQHLIDEEFCDGHRYYTKEAHLQSLPDEAIDILVEFFRDMPMGGEVEILGLGGAIDDVPEDGSAFSNRQYQMWLNFAMAWDDAGLDADYITQIRACAAELKPWTGTGVYVNMLNADEDLPGRVVEAYGEDKYARLGRIKAQYDPANLFRVNYNITPR
jgi:FAD/FMN-containing dehydrogenase